MDSSILKQYTYTYDADDETNQSKDDMSLGLLAGMVVGIIVFVVVIGLVVLFMIRKRRGDGDNPIGVDEPNYPEVGDETVHEYGRAETRVGRTMRMADPSEFDEPSDAFRVDPFAEVDDDLWDNI